MIVRDDGWDGPAAKAIIEASLARSDRAEIEALVWSLYDRIERLWSKVDEEIAVGNVKAMVAGWELPKDHAERFARTFAAMKNLEASMKAAGIRSPYWGGNDA